MDPRYAKQRKSSVVDMKSTGVGDGVGCCISPCIAEVGGALHVHRPTIHTLHAGVPSTRTQDDPALLCSCVCAAGGRAGGSITAALFLKVRCGIVMWQQQR